ncbi:acyl-CoA thioesterase II [Geobacter argillaceus]|uniref:Acyl-CoA thioesterase 2 n=1 Tax=Geobacter argillaceus TaxID=345631 RepID=A0A562VHU2_9BACT|nr:acyl-CoA thioesterase II [Geobacter argillaceus]TWJ17479.1 acyl-CoA thioesterase-2 [Geobacter argillaceus]
MMHSSVEDMLKLLDLEQIEENIFRGESRDIGGKSVFGGQVLGQALAAACRTVKGSSAHSLHAYFLRPGDMTAPIVYSVDRIRDGHSFATRRIVAIQHGRPIFNMAASFQKEESGFEHQNGMPDVPGPDDLPSLAELRRQAVELDPDRFKDRSAWQVPLDIRPVLPANPYLADTSPPLQTLWMRTLEAVPPAPDLHQAILAYASDFALFRTAVLPYKKALREMNAQMASLDHSMWFHRPCRVDQWLLLVMESPSASGARGFATGSIFTRDGALVATICQEGLMRINPVS